MARSAPIDGAFRLSRNPPLCDGSNTETDVGVIKFGLIANKAIPPCGLQAYGG